MQLTSLFLAFYLLLGSCIPNSDYSQLGHLADLRAHYLEHQAEAAEQGDQLTFLEFLYLHFIDATHHADADHEEDHQQLPLQSLNGAVSFVVSSFAFPTFEVKSSLFSTTTVYQNLFYLQGFQFSELRPPSF